MRFGIANVVYSTVIFMIGCDWHELTPTVGTGSVPELSYGVGRHGHFDTTIDECTEFIRRNPQDARAYYDRALTYGHLDQHAKAIDDFTQCLSLTPNDSLSFHGRAIAYFLLNRYSAAIADFTSAIRLVPTDAESHYGRGLCFGRVGDVEQALQDFQHAIELNPSMSRAYYAIEQLKEDMERGKNGT
ncbi:MAG: tetratricopeptide repeat protein [Planctomycetaceae bacterium]